MSGFDRLAQRLTARAKALGDAHAESRRLERQGDETRWRRADLLWPTTAKG